MVRYSANLPMLKITAPRCSQVARALECGGRPICVALFFCLSLLFPGCVKGRVSGFSTVMFTTTIFVAVAEAVVIFIILFAFLKVFLDNGGSAVLGFSVVNTVLFVPLSSTLLSEFNRGTNAGNSVFTFVRKQFVSCTRANGTRSSIKALACHFT